MKAYYTPKGQVHTENGSLYQLEMSGVMKIIHVHNAIIVDKINLQVVDESKPIFLFASVVLSDESSIFRFDEHIKEQTEMKKGKVTAKSVLGSELDVTMTQHHDRAEAYVILRRNDEVYITRSVHYVAEAYREYPEISKEDLLAFVASEVTWDDLAEKSVLLEVKRQEVVTLSKKYDNAKAEVLHLKDVNNQLERSISAIQDNLEKVPLFVRNFFSSHLFQVIRRFLS